MTNPAIYVKLTKNSSDDEYTKIIYGDRGCGKNEYRFLFKALGNLERSTAEELLVCLAWQHPGLRRIFVRLSRKRRTVIVLSIQVGVMTRS